MGALLSIFQFFESLNSLIEKSDNELPPPPNETKEDDIIVGNHLAFIFDTTVYNKSRYISKTEISYIKDSILKAKEVFESFITAWPKKYKVNIGVDTNLANTDTAGTAIESSYNKDEDVYIGHIWYNPDYLDPNNKNFEDQIFLNDIKMSIRIPILIHETLHVFGLVGIGDGAKFVNKTEHLYTGQHGITGYRTLLMNCKQLNSVINCNSTTVNNIIGIPWEDNLGQGTKHSHFEECLSLDGEEYNVGETRIINNVPYPTLINEIMSGYLNKYNYITYMTLGCLKDVGFSINRFNKNSKWFPYNSSPHMICVIPFRIINTNNNIKPYYKIIDTLHFLKTNNISKIPIRTNIYYAFQCTGQSSVDGTNPFYIGILNNNEFHPKDNKINDTLRIKNNDLPILSVCRNKNNVVLKKYNNLPLTIYYYNSNNDEFKSTFDI